MEKIIKKKKCHFLEPKWLALRNEHVYEKPGTINNNTHTKKKVRNTKGRIHLGILKKI